MKLLLKSKNRSTLVNTLGHDSSRDYIYIILVDIKGCAGEYLHYSLPCVKIHCHRAGMGGEKHIAMELEFIDLK
jgi:hypothetical protein